MSYACVNPQQEWYERLEGRELCNPNNSDIIMQNRDKAWCKQTYNDYIKKKYKHFLNK